MMDRRQFLRRSALIAAGIVAADQLDVLEMLAPRRLFAGADFDDRTTWPLGFVDVMNIPVDVTWSVDHTGYEWGVPRTHWIVTPPPHTSIRLHSQADSMTR